MYSLLKWKSSQTKDIFQLRTCCTISYSIWCYQCHLNLIKKWFPYKGLTFRKVFINYYTQNTLKPAWSALIFIKRCSHKEIRLNRAELSHWQWYVWLFSLCSFAFFCFCGYIIYTLKLFIPIQRGWGENYSHTNNVLIRLYLKSIELLRRDVLRKLICFSVVSYRLWYTMAFKRNYT